MATIANLTQVEADYTVVESVPTPIVQALPLPAIIWGQLFDMELDMPVVGLEPPYYIMGALHSGGDHLEPTLGQIWPRIG